MCPKMQTSPSHTEDWKAALLISRHNLRDDIAQNVHLKRADHITQNKFDPDMCVEHCSAIPCHSMLWRDVTLQFVLYFDIVFDVIACT